MNGTRLAAAIGAICVLSQAIPAQAIFNADPPVVETVRLYDGGHPMRVLWIAAHPDDEDTNLIAWLARGRNVNTAYMSLTRGDGGQNLIGNELGEALGVIRTEELLAARRIDGAHQFFGRAYDFGFSKTADETRKHWPQDSLLHDVIIVMRAFQPQIIITTFSGTPRDGHGQHQISAIVARDAYNLAGDTIRFPVREYGPPWTPLKFYRLARFSPEDRTDSINVGEYNPYLGLSYQEIAADSRSQHKSQGEGTLRRKGVVWDYLTREDSRIAAPAAKEEQSIFAGFDTNSVRNVVRDGRVQAPAPAVPIELEAVADRQAVALGDSASISLAIYNRGHVPISIPAIVANGAPRVVFPDSVYRWKQWYVGREITQPWWLATPRNGDLFAPKITGISEDAREVRSGAHIFVTSSEMGRLYLSSPIVFHYVDRVRGDVQRPLIVAPGVSITLDQAVTMGRANGPFNQLLKATLRSALADSTPVTVTLALPRGLSTDSLARTIVMAAGATRTLTFRLRGALPRGIHQITATASAKGKSYQTGYIPIEYPHINPQRIYRPSTMSVNAVDVILPPRLNVAYVPGVGDNVAPVLQQLGVPLTIVDPDEIPQTDLSRFTAVVVGPRAYQASQTLQDNNEYLLAYVRNGGRLVVQYGQGEMQRPGITPYPITLQQRAERVTDENAPVTFTDPASPLLNTPNKITQVDFKGWVQERATYMPTSFDSHYRTMLAMNDPGEPPNRAAILAAPYGRGTYIYVSTRAFSAASSRRIRWRAHLRQPPRRQHNQMRLRRARWLATLATLALGACRSDGRKVLIVYSPHGKELLEYLEKGFEKAHPDVDVQWVDMGSQEVLERVRAEKPNPQADVWFGAPAEAFDRATKEDLLQPYKPTWAAAIDPEAREARDNWYGTYLTPEVIGYNRDAVKDADAPKDWDDLIDPKYKGKILIRDPIASGTMRAIFGAIMARSIAQTGKPDAGYEWLRKLDANTREYVLNPTILYQKLGRQEGVITPWDMPDFATLEQRTRIPIKYVIPTSGTPLLVDGIAIVRGSKHPKEAQEYYEYVTTPDAMIAAADSFLRIPARKDIPVSKLPSWIRDALAQIKPMPVDRELMAAHLDEWMKYWDANIRNRGQRQ